MINSVHVKNAYFRPLVSILLGVLVALTLIACTQNEPAPPPTLENISVPTPTPPPTATPFVAPTAAPENQANEADEAAGPGEGSEDDGLLSGFITEDGGEQDPAVDPAVPTEGESAGAIESVGLEPAEVTIDLQNGELNTWVEVDPPPGWRITQGLDGLVLAKEPELIPQSSFILVRRWGNVVNLEDYIAYLPDAVEEPNSTVAFKLGGYDWEGVFVTNETNSYRAFFGVSNDVLPSFSLLVFVPGPDPLPGEEAITRETLLEVWTFDVGDLNSILRRMAFY